MKSHMSDSRRHILESKRLLLVKHVIVSESYDDVGLVDDLVSGFSLVGDVPISLSFWQTGTRIASEHCVCFAAELSVGMIHSLKTLTDRMSNANPVAWISICCTPMYS